MVNKITSRLKYTRNADIHYRVNTLLIVSLDFFVICLLLI